MISFTLRSNERVQSDQPADYTGPIAHAAACVQRVLSAKHNGVRLEEGSDVA